jgi:hypothetical protein
MASFNDLTPEEKTAIDVIISYKPTNNEQKEQLRQVYTDAYASGVGDAHDLVVSQVELINAKPLIYTSLSEGERKAIDGIVGSSKPEYSTPALETFRRESLARQYKGYEGYGYDMVRSALKSQGLGL